MKIKPKNANQQEVLNIAVNIASLNEFEASGVGCDAWPGNRRNSCFKYRRDKNCSVSVQIPKA
ncbi:MAG TPA: hypothetical protein VME23_19515 [Terracidiphilus sp.]|nr:hypothetical protein [Terracidiphilus sp.]